MNSKHSSLPRMIGMENVGNWGKETIPWQKRDYCKGLGSGGMQATVKDKCSLDGNALDGAWVQEG